MGEANFYYFTCLNSSLHWSLVLFAATVIAQTTIPTNNFEATTFEPARTCSTHFTDFLFNAFHRFPTRNHLDVENVWIYLSPELRLRMRGRCQQADQHGVVRQLRLQLDGVPLFPG